MKMDLHCCLSLLRCFFTDLLSFNPHIVLFAIAHLVGPIRGLASTSRKSTTDTLPSAAGFWSCRCQLLTPYALLASDAHWPLQGRNEKGKHMTTVCRPAKSASCPAALGACILFKSPCRLKATSSTCRVVPAQGL